MLSNVFYYPKNNFETCRESIRTCCVQVRTKKNIPESWLHVPSIVFFHFLWAYVARKGRETVEIPSLLFKAKTVDPNPLFPDQFVPVDWEGKRRLFWFDCVAAVESSATFDSVSLACCSFLPQTAVDHSCIIFFLQWSSSSLFRPNKWRIICCFPLP